jgi:hypothetical protein
MLGLLRRLYGKLGFLRRARWICLFFGLLLSAALAINEVSTLVGEVSIDGNSYPASAMWGPTHLIGKQDAFASWAKATGAGFDLRGWLMWTSYLDLGYILGYAAVFTGLFLRWDLKLPRWYLDFRLWIGALVLTDLAEDLFSIFAIQALPSKGTEYGSWALTPLVIASGLKWAAFTLVLLVGVFGFARNTADRARFRNARAVLRLHRFQLISLAGLAVLLILPGSDVLQQGVDIERAWLLTDDSVLRRTGYLAAAVLVMLGLSAVLRYLASVHVSDLYVPAPAAPTQSASAEDSRLQSSDTVPYWLICALSMLLIASLLRVLHWARIYWAPVFGIVAVLVVVQLLVWVFRNFPLLQPLPPRRDESALRPLAWKVGRLIAIGVLAVLWLSLVRAYTAAMLVGTERLLAGCVVGAGTVLTCATLCWAGAPPGDLALLGDPDFTVRRWQRYLHPQLIGALDWRTANVRGAAYQAEPVRPLWSVLPAAALTLATVVPLLVFPVPMAKTLGAVGVIGFCLTALSLFFAVLSITTQQVKPARLLLMLRMRRTPLLGILTVILLLSTFLGRTDMLHRIRGPATAAGSTSVADTRVDIHAAFGQWRTAGSCVIASPTDATLRIRPLLFVAAEGGGVRAAWWTVKAMDQLVSTTCRKSVLLTSGVSGGAVGLGLMATSSSADTELTKLAGQDAVAVGLAGMLSRDLVAGIFGLNVEVADGADDPYPDRAGLIEQEWESRSKLATPFPASPTGTAPWYTVFNGTSVLHGCRVLLANVRIGTDDPPDCRSPTATVPGGYDLLADQNCLLGLRTSTASLLAARFPYVTPSGIVPSCKDQGKAADQILDGGYSENTGMDTLDAALAELMPDIRSANNAAIAGNSPLIVPIVVFLHNTPVASVGTVASTPKPSVEAFVPLQNASSAAGDLARPATLLARSQTIAARWLDVPPDPTTPADRTAARIKAEVQAMLPDYTITIAPQQTPEIAVPLGWSLSRASRSSLDDALAAYVKCSTTAPICPQGREFGMLHRMTDAGAD